MSNDPTASKPLRSQGSGSTPSILVVDDDADIRQVMQLVLESAGYRVVCAADGQGGLKILESEAFGLVITDMLMPGRDGLELLAAVKKSGPSVKVLVMSGGGMIGADDYLKVAKKLGAHGVLEKPFAAEMLLTTVAGLLKKEG